MTTFNLCPLVDLKSMLDMQGTAVMDTNKYDQLLQIIIDMVSDRINKHCGRTFEHAAQTEYYDGDGRRNFFYVKVCPIDEAVDVVVYDDLDRDYNADDEVDSTDIVVYPDTGKILWEGGTFSNGNRNVKITYTGGYKQTTIPDQLKFAALEQCAFTFRNRVNIGVTAKSDDMGSMTKVIGDFRLLDSVVSALLPWRRVEF